MPFYLKPRDISPDLPGVRSILVVPCRFCPAASFAVREKKPYIELFRNFLRTAVYESHIQDLKTRLARAGIRTEVFDNKTPNQFIVCMWSSGRRQELKRRASGYDAVLVLGCGAAVKTAEDSTESTNCRVIRGMEVEGIMNVIPSLHFPCNVSLEVTSVIRVLEYPLGQAGQSAAGEAAEPRR